MPDRTISDSLAHSSGDIGTPSVPEQQRPQQDGNQQRHCQREERAEELPDDEVVPTDRVGKGQRERAAFFFARYGVVGEKDREEREDDLKDELEIQEPEHGIDRLVVVP